MKKLNEREKAIKQGYVNCLEGKQTAVALRNNGKWTPTKSPRKCSVIRFRTPDGLSYTGNPQRIEELF